MSDIELIGFPSSSYVWAVRMALEILVEDVGVAHAATSTSDLSLVTISS